MRGFRQMKIDRVIAALVGSAACAALIVACTPDIFNQSLKAPMTEERTGPTLILASDENIRLVSGLAVPQLPAGSKWVPRGHIDQGNTYSRADGIFALDFGGYGDEFEAFLVINQASIVGIYFPYQQAFVRCTTPVPLNQLR
jgi:hypothetical protein